MASRGSSRSLVGLQLLAIGRIPRCKSCPRYRSLQQDHRRSAVSEHPLPQIPGGCTHQVCDPLVARHEAGRAGDRAQDSDRWIGVSPTGQAVP
jgi:hypothetical protein